MANNYYTVGTTFTPGTTARSADVNTELSGVATGFDFLPSDTSALTRNVSTLAPETGSGNAYVVAMPDTRTANQDGDEIVFFATHGNTGASTIVVDGLGAVAIRDHLGVALATGTIVNGRVYSLRYDATNGYFVIATTFGQTVQMSTVTGTSTDNPEDAGLTSFNAQLNWENASAQALFDIGYAAGKTVLYTNHVWAGNQAFLQDDATGNQKTIFTMGLTGPTAINRDGVVRELKSAYAISQIKDADYSFVDGDSGTVITHTDATIRTYTLPVAPITFSSGWEVHVLNRGTANVVISDGDSAMVYLDGIGTNSETGQFIVPPGGSCRILLPSFTLGFYILDAKGLSRPTLSKLADKSLATNVTLEDDNHLAGWTDLQADARYSIEGWIHYTQNIGDFKCRFQSSQTLVSGAVSYDARDATGTAASDHFSDITGSLTLIGLSDGSEIGMFIKGYFHTHATLATVIDFQWAQNTSHANNTTVREGSWIKIERIE